MSEKRKNNRAPSSHSPREGSHEEKTTASCYAHLKSGVYDVEDTVKRAVGGYTANSQVVHPMKKPPVYCAAAVGGGALQARQCSSKKWTSWRLAPASNRSTLPRIRIRVENARHRRTNMRRVPRGCPRRDRARLAGAQIHALRDRGQPFHAGRPTHHRDPSRSSCIRRSTRSSCTQCPQRQTTTIRTARSVVRSCLGRLLPQVVRVVGVKACGLGARYGKAQYGRARYVGDRRVCRRTVRALIRCSSQDARKL